MYPIWLEIFYDINKGLFAVEIEVAGSYEIYNPYTGRETPNDNPPEKSEPCPLKIRDTTICTLEDLNSSLKNNDLDVHDFPLVNYGRIDEATHLIDEALGHLHSIGDPEDE